MTNKEYSISRDLLLAALAYLLLTVIVVWPVSAHLTTAVAGFEGRDSLQLVWFNWWGVKSLLALQSSPAQVEWLYYPQGANHPVLLATLFVPLLATPLTLAGGPKLAYNAMFLASFVLGGALTYLLVLALIRSRAAAFAAGVIFIFAPHRMGHALAGHLLLIMTWSLPLYALALTYLIRQPSWRWAGVGGAALAILTLTQPLHLAYFALPVTLIYGGGLLLRKAKEASSEERTSGAAKTVEKPVWSYLAQKNSGRALRATLPYAAGMLSLAALLLLPFYWPLLAASRQGELTYITNEGLQDHSTDLLAFALPSPYHPLWDQTGSPPALLTQIIDTPRDMEERLAYLGLAPVGLTLWAVWRRRSQVYLWLATAVTTAILSLGPALHILGNEAGLPLPYAWLAEWPFLSWSRTPGRLNETTMLAVAVTAAAGLAAWLTRLDRPCKRKLVTTGVVLFILFEYLTIFPFPLAGQKVPPFYRRLAGEAPAEPLLDMPVTGSRRASNYSLLYQTLHDRPIAGGYVQREVPGTAETAQFFDRLLSPAPAAVVVEGMPPIPVRQRLLKESGIRQVTARRWLMTDSAATETLAFMPRVLGSAYHVTGELLAWRPPPVETPLPDHTLLLSEQGWETIDGALHLKEEGLLFVYAARPGPATLTVVVRRGQAGQRLWVAEEPLAAGEGDLRREISLDLRPRLNWLAFRLTNCAGECRAVFSHISINAQEEIAP